MVKNVRIPSITSIETAVRMYYEKTELNNADVKELFGEHSSTTIAKLKKLVRERVVEEKYLFGTLKTFLHGRHMKCGDSILTIWSIGWRN